MKGKIILVLILTLSFSFNLKKTKKSFVPPGTVQVTEHFFADEVEITNFAWQEYEFWTKTTYGKNSKEHLETLPDTLVWTDTMAYNGPYAKYYYRNIAYRDYPVVGISYKQATAFCKWRTVRVKEFLAKSNRETLPAASFEYRLPTKKEWEFLSTDCLQLFSNNGKDKRGHSNFNCARPYGDKQNISSSSEDVTAPVYSFTKSNFGLFNLIGNVSEMVSEEGLSKGGSWFNVIEECQVNKDILYSKPTAWLGFRCVCEVK